MKINKPIAFLSLFVLTGCSMESLPIPNGGTSADDNPKSTILRRDFNATNVALSIEITFPMNGTSSTEPGRMEFANNVAKIDGEHPSYYVLENRNLRLAYYTNSAYYYSPTKLPFETDTLTPYMVFVLLNGTADFKENIFDLFNNLKDSDFVAKAIGGYDLPDIVLHPNVPESIQIRNYSDEICAIRFKDIHVSFENEKLKTFECNYRAFNINSIESDVYEIVPDIMDRSYMKLEFSDYGQISFELPSPILESAY